MAIIHVQVMDFSIEMEMIKNKIESPKIRIKMKTASNLRLSRLLTVKERLHKLEDMVIEISKISV